MPNYYFDTSALAKRYHAEQGTSRVDQLLDDPQNHCFVSRIGLVELHSVLMKHVRLGNLSQVDLQTALTLLQSDLARFVLKVLPLKEAQFNDAQVLLRRLGPTRSLYTLDALHLAVAQSLATAQMPAILACSDRRLLALAASESLPTLDPEQP